MRRARPAAAATTNSLEAPARELPLDIDVEPPRRPTPNPAPGPRAADRIREALLRWLEEDM